MDNKHYSGEDEMKELEKQYISVAGDLKTPIDFNMLRALTKNLGQNYTKEELEGLILEVDENENGTIEFDEFVKAMKSKLKDDEYTIKIAFGILDRTESGYISANDLRHAMLCLGENYTIEEVTEMMSLIDEDQDGVINFQEFNKLIRQINMINEL